MQVNHQRHILLKYNSYNSNDYAYENGVNYFDTAPVYLQGQSEKATGIALKRHPRESYFIATKLSNFSNHSRENSMEMYRKSFENLQTDYIDYYLLHSISGYDAFKQRYVDNGMIDFLMEERKAGRIRNLGFSFHGSAEGFDEMMEYHEKYHWDFVQIQRELEKISVAVEGLQLWTERMAATGQIDEEQYQELQR